MSNFIKHVNERSIYLPLTSVVVHNRDSTGALNITASTLGADDGAGGSVISAMSDYLIVRANTWVAGQVLGFGQTVAWDLSSGSPRTVVKADSANITDIVCGVVLNFAVASGDEVYVLQEGIHPLVKFIDTTTTAGMAALIETTVVGGGEVIGAAEAGTLNDSFRVGRVLAADGDIDTNGANDFRAPVYVNCPLA